jgi:hypothetical protein
MAQEGRYPLVSAWGSSRAMTAGLIELCTREPRGSFINSPNVWSTWWLNGITIVSNTKTAADTVGATGFFIQ